MRQAIALITSGLLMAEVALPPAPLPTYTAAERRHWSFQPITAPALPAFTTSADKAYGAFLVLGPNILALTDSGTLILFAADPKECRELGRAQVCGANWCNPAYVDGKLFLRDGLRQNGDWLALDLRP